MAQKETNKLILFFFLCLVTNQVIGNPELKKKDTHKRLMEVNQNWAALAYEIQYTFTPTSERELIQLHLLNVIAYLESQPLTALNEEQKQSRLTNLSTLKAYCNKGNFPKNTLTTFRTPIFIDAQGVHCAVGQLLKKTGSGKIAREIADKQLLAYLREINHPDLTNWQKTCGFSLFELALIQPTYGPPIPVCAAPSPIKWEKVTPEKSGIVRLFQYHNIMYGIAQTNKSNKHEVKRYSKKKKQWLTEGTEINGDILDLVFSNGKLFISVLLPEEDHPHQLLKLEGFKWKKIAHFNGNIRTIEEFQNSLYVLGDFKKVNDSVTANFVVINKNSIKPFSPIGLRNTQFDHIKSSETALFLLSYGGIFKFKNDTIRYLNSIQYYQYFTDFSLDAVKDTLFLTSLGLLGYDSYYENLQHSSSSMNNMLIGYDPQSHLIHFTKSKKVNKKMMIAGYFRTSTLEPHTNDERYITQCPETSSAHWYGEGLIYECGQLYYPILKKGTVLDFVQLNDHVYILQQNGSVSCANLSSIEEKIVELRKRSMNID